MRQDLVGVTRWLSLAASPTFAIMALLTAGDARADMLCSTVGASPLGGMATMYLLMAAFHAGPWLRLAARRTSLSPLPEGEGGTRAESVGG